MRIVFRADANSRIGVGHIMRCLSIADVFRFRGHDVVIVLADNTAVELIHNRGYETAVIGSDFSDMESEISLWGSDLKNPDILIVDSYYVTSQYLLELKSKIVKKGELVYIDDQAKFPYPVDVLVAFGMHLNIGIYEALYSHDRLDFNKPKILQGVEYMPLRSMFKILKKKVQNEVVKNVLISTGGSDKSHLILKFLYYIQENIREYDYTFHILIGSLNSDRDAIRFIAEEIGTTIIIHENVSNMKSLIEQMDICVSAAGSTLYEIAACGVPLITYSMADNQIIGAKAFFDNGLAENVGDLRKRKALESEEELIDELNTDSIEHIILKIRELSADYSKRVKMGNKMQTYIDGYGADRLADALLKYKHS